MDFSKPRVLITGGLGQIGWELCFLLRSKFGDDNVVLSDIKAPKGFFFCHDLNETDLSHLESAPFRYVDVSDVGSISKV